MLWVAEWSPGERERERREICTSREGGWREIEFQLDVVFNLVRPARSPAPRRCRSVAVALGLADAAFANVVASLRFLAACLLCLYVLQR